MDYRLADHGERVAWLVYRLMEDRGGYDAEQVSRVCALAFLHDLGTYKTETLDSLAGVEALTGFEMGESAPHAAYGYVFLDAMLPGCSYTDLVFYHHLPWRCLPATGCPHPELVSMICLADRFDLLTATGKGQAVAPLLQTYRGSLFSPEETDRLLRLDADGALQRALTTGSYRAGLAEALLELPVSPQQRLEYLQALVCTIDFRSPHTVTHTLTMASLALELGRRFGLPERRLDEIYLAGLLHDLGKVVTPIDILEKPGRLTDYEFSIMRDHVLVTEAILAGAVDDAILQMAIRHHERLDGTGYPRGLTAQELTLEQMLLAVADVASALLGRRSYKQPMSGEQVRRILQEEAQAGHLSPLVVERFLADFDAILCAAEEQGRGAMQRYQSIVARYPEALKTLARLSAQPV